MNLPCRRSGSRVQAEVAAAIAEAALSPAGHCRFNCFALTYLCDPNGGGVSVTSAGTETRHFRPDGLVCALSRWSRTTNGLHSFQRTTLCVMVLRRVHPCRRPLPRTRGTFSANASGAHARRIRARLNGAAPKRTSPLRHSPCIGSTFAGVVYSDPTMATIREVAATAGVSVTTASDALGGRGRVAATTRERIARIADELGYVANRHAQRLVKRQSRTLAIQIAGFTQEGGAQLLPDAAFFLDVLNGAAAAAAARDYEIVVVPYEADADRTSALAIDGAIVVDPHGEEEFLENLRRRGTPVVSVGRPTRRAAEFPYVDNDHPGITIQMLDHLQSMGYVHPALIATARSRSYVSDIYQTYLQWVHGNGVPPLIVELAEPPVVGSAARAFQELLMSPTPPDAIYTTYGQLALGVLWKIRQAGLFAPQDIGVACAVDADTLRWVEPPVTSVELNPVKVGETAGALLVDLVEGRNVPDRTVIDSRLIFRTSTKRF